MSWLQLLATFIMGILVYNVNQSINRVVTIKTTINTLFGIFGNRLNFKDEDCDYIYKLLIDEILSLEKMHDNNYYVFKQINKLRQLKDLYHKMSSGDPVDLARELYDIKFRPLGRSFVILSLLNIHIDGQH
jgi:hypothetical protein